MSECEIVMLALAVIALVGWAAFFSKQGRG